MTEVTLYATGLLIGRLISMVFIVLVLHKQYCLFKLTIERRYANFRRVLFALSIGIFLGNFVPIALDTTTIVGQYSARRVSAFAIAYAYSNTITAVLSAVAIWTLYRMAHRIVRD